MPRGIPKSGKRVSRTNERRALRPLQIDSEQLYDVGEAAGARGRSIPSTWNDIREGRLQARKVGGRTLILGRWIIEANLRDAGIEMEIASEAPAAANDE